MHALEKWEMDKERLRPQPRPGHHSSPLIEGPAPHSGLGPTTPVLGDRSHQRGKRTKN